MNNDLSSELTFTEHKKHYNIGDPDPSLRQAEKYGGVKPVEGIPTLPS